jgi:putative transposase
MHPGAPAEPVLAAWGITTQSSPVLLGLAPGAHEATTPGPAPSRQRCLVHRARNLLARVPTHAQDEVKAAFWQMFDDITVDPGQLAVDEARRRAEAFADRYRKALPGGGRLSAGQLARAHHVPALPA